ncbi:ABC transporter ATP-binding protein [Euhalothece natronophila Z-M001]|uniref:ABC transporter ATP-binding protein n=1 Tax=Euhalothece natronophila Z-M001 TaxID=522448 RepID=A0A5B8NP56_9CHRO|nr:ABC transporter ATP-binding protein [Euhalothece natronophila]QDZ40726.1 ABC transporter ATP-binding protein [Euhalothece natronophila Z-M001]
MQRQLTNFKARWKKYFSSFLENPAYRVIFATINHHRLLILLNIHANLLAAAFEGTTFGSIYLALQVLQDDQVDSLLNHPIIANTFLSSFLHEFTQGQLFIGLIVLAVFMQFLRHSFEYIGAVSSDYLSARIQAQMVERIFAQIMSFTFSCASSYKVGDLVTYINQTAYTIQRQIYYIDIIFVTILTIIAQAVVLFTISPGLSGVTIIICAIALLLQKSLIPRIKRTAKQVAQVRANVYKQIVESLQALRVIHIFGRQLEARQQVHELQRHLVPKLEYQSRLSRLTKPLGNTLTLITIATLLIIGYFMLRDSAAVLPSLVTFLAVLNRLSMHLNGVTEKNNRLAENAGDFNRLREILEPEGKEFSRVGGKVFNGLKKEIKFDHISLQYSEEQKLALKDVSFVLEKGKVTALVGGSGAGKSSIADLLVGLYQPTSGVILVDGEDLNEYNMTSWRSRLGVVSQDTFIFNTTIGNNIRYGKPSATEEEVRKSAIAAQADQFIREFPQGYDTVVGERGYRLSGGQRQRIALARAILKEPEILILDEATSALDSHSEYLVQEALKEFQRDRTVLVIAHRLSTIVNADQIIVLENGEVMEQGSHEALLNQGGKYLDYWRLQSESQSSQVT